MNKIKLFNNWDKFYSNNFWLWKCKHIFTQWRSQIWNNHGLNLLILDFSWSLSIVNFCIISNSITVNSALSHDLIIPFQFMPFSILPVTSDFRLLPFSILPITSDFRLFTFSILPITSENSVYFHFPYFRFPKIPFTSIFRVLFSILPCFFLLFILPCYFSYFPCLPYLRRQTDDK